MKFSKLIGMIILSGTLIGCGHSAQHSVYFESGSDRLTSSSKQTLKQVAKMVEAKEQKDKFMKADTRIRLSGYSDTVGKRKLNRELAKKRLSSVKNELIRLGLDKKHITKTSFGEGWMIDKKSKNNPKKRRVDIDLY